MARKLYGKRRAAQQRGATAQMQKQGTEESKTRDARNREMNRMAREQEEAQEKGIFEGGWMKALGTIVAIGAIMVVTGGFGLPALFGAAGSGATLAGGGWLAAGTAAASGLGTYAGMKMGDAMGGDVEGEMEAAGEIDQSALYRGTVGGNYGTMFDPLQGLSDKGGAMSSTYGAQKRSSYTYAPLTAGVTSGAGTFLPGV